MQLTISKEKKLRKINNFMDNLITTKVHDCEIKIALLFNILIYYNYYNKYKIYIYIYIYLLFQN